MTWNACARPANGLSTFKLEDVTKKYMEILSSLGISNNIGHIVKLTDEYTKLTAQLRMSTSSTQEYGRGV